MYDVIKMAEDYAQNLLKCGIIQPEQLGIIINAVLHGSKAAIQNLSNIQNSNGVYLIPNPLPIGSRKSETDDV